MELEGYMCTLLHTHAHTNTCIYICADTYRYPCLFPVVVSWMGMATLQRCCTSLGDLYPGMQIRCPVPSNSLDPLVRVQRIFADFRRP